MNEGANLKKAFVATKSGLPDARTDGGVGLTGNDPAFGYISRLLPLCILYTIIVYKIHNEDSGPGPSPSPIHFGK
jgi:hypothetical protein